MVKKSRFTTLLGAGLIVYAGLATAQEAAGDPAAMARADTKPPRIAQVIAPGTMFQNFVTGSISSQARIKATLTRKIGQMLMIGFPGSAPRGAWARHIRGDIRAGKIGGVILFEHNIQSPRQLAALTNYLRKGAPSLPFIAVDQEGGKVQRLRQRNGFFDTPGARSLSREDPVLANLAYKRMAEELARSGVNVNLGPVVDLDINRKNKVISKLGRSYGAQPSRVTQYAQSFIEAHNSAGVLTALKHFPGHGSSTVDTHKGLADIRRTWRRAELEPYVRLVKSGVDMIMVGHLYHPRFSDDGAPASLSRKAIMQEIRGRLRFKGLVITDDLEMRAITRHYGFDDAVVRAVQAGNDILIISNQAKPDRYLAGRALAAIIKAVRDHKISPQRIEQSYRRILAAKTRLSRQLAARRAVVPARGQR